MYDNFLFFCPSRWKAVYINYNYNSIKLDLTQMSFLHQKGNAVIKHLLHGLELKPQAFQLCSVQFIVWSVQGIKPEVLTHELSKVMLSLKNIVCLEPKWPSFERMLTFLGYERMDSDTTARRLTHWSPIQQSYKGSVHGHFHAHKQGCGRVQHHQYEHIPFFHATWTSLLPLFFQIKAAIFTALFLH